MPQDMCWRWQVGTISVGFLSRTTVTGLKRRDMRNRIRLTTWSSDADAPAEHSAGGKYPEKPSLNRTDVGRKICAKEDLILPHFVRFWCFVSRITLSQLELLLIRNYVSATFSNIILHTWRVLSKVLSIVFPAWESTAPSVIVARIQCWDYLWIVTFIRLTVAELYFCDIRELDFPYFILLSHSIVSNHGSIRSEN